MEDNKVNPNVESTTFAQPVPEKTELERLQDRIANFKVSITPTVAQLAQVLMNQSLQNPTKVEDLDGYVQVRNELKVGLDEYQTQLSQAQNRMVQLQQEHEIAKSMELARREEDLKAARDGERKRRKDAEAKQRQLEAVLASHGIQMDLDGDGMIGLQVGEQTENLTADQQVTLKGLLDESKAAVGGTSRAFSQARAMNPEPTLNLTSGNSTNVETTIAIGDGTIPQSETTFTTPVNRTAEQITSAKKSFQEWDEANQPSIPVDAKGTDEFLEEVQEVESAYDVVGTNPNRPHNSGPVISDTNSPSIIEDELAKAAPSITGEPIAEVKEKSRMDIIGQNGNTGEHYAELDKSASEQMQDELEPIGVGVRLVPEDDITDFDTPPAEEDEVVEVTIPTESELKGMTKSKILREAKSLGFDTVTTKDSKTMMIDNFKSSTEAFIADLQDSGEFVSATDSGDTDEGGSDDRDGGYFK
jgi:hypothetical protein